MRRTPIIAILLLLLPVALMAQRWKQAALPAPYDKGYYLDVYFLPSDPQMGWACDNDSGYVVRTTNGGATWTGTRIGTPGTRCHLEYIQFFANGVGYTSGPCGVWKSNDNGMTWTQLTLPSPAIGVWGAWFRSATEGWVTGGGCGYNRFLRTTDGGSTFSEYLDTNIKRSNLSDPLWQSDMAANEVYAIGNGTLWRSTDDGLTWGVESYTGANSPWHEEMARSGNTFMVACAQSNCATGGYTGGGVRTSVDDGATWSAFEIGEDIFGVFLLSSQQGWAAGWDANVWHTTNAGTNWTKKNCGLNGAHMDDITFINDTTGWVVGKGLFHLAPPLRTTSDSLLVFSSTCPDSSRFDTVWVENVNFNASPWRSKFVGPEEYMFRVVNILPPIMPSCSRIPVIIEYRALQPGAHNASFVIEISDPDTVLVVDLQGSRRTFTAYPEDTLVEFRQRAGSIGRRVVNWRSTGSPAEVLTSITPTLADTTIIMTATTPVVIPPAPQVVQTFIESTPADTGWSTQRFRFRLAPCDRDTFVTVRVYGESPIINCINDLAIDAQCQSVDTMYVPFSNTGNVPLKILGVTFEGLGTLPFRFIGYTSRRAVLNYQLPAGEADTMMIEYTVASGNDVADLVIENDDYSKTRGIVNKWRVALQARSTSPVFKITPLRIDLGKVCTGVVLDSSISIKNDGVSTLTYRASTSSSSISGISGSTTSVTPNDTRVQRFRWTPTALGAVSDTILLNIQPCDSLVAVILTATVNEAGITITPSPLIDSIPVGGTYRGQVTIGSIGTDTVIITAIDHLPAGNAIKLGIPNIPFMLTEGVFMNIDVEWTSNIIERLPTQLVVTTQGACSGTRTSDIILSTYSNFMKVGPQSVALNAECTMQKQRDTINVTSLLMQPVSMNAPTISNASDGAITIVSPTTNIVIAPLGTEMVIVEYDPVVSSNSTATVEITFPAYTDKFSIPVTATYRVSDWHADTTTISAGTVGACDPDITYQIALWNNGTLDEAVEVDVASLPQGFTVTPSSIVVAAGDTTTVTLTIAPSQLAVGLTEDDVRFLGRTCGGAYVVRASAEQTSGRLTLTPDPLDAGTVEIGSLVVVQATVTNPLNVPQRIVSLVINPAQPSWTLLDNVNGLVLAPGATQVVNLRFAPTAAGLASANLVLQWAEPCTTSTSITLVGRGRDVVVPPDYTARLWIDRYSVAPEAVVAIPVRWQGNISAAGVQRVDVDVVFTYLNLTVDSVTAGSMPDVALTSVIEPGVVRLTLTPTGARAGDEGTMAVIHGVAHSALPDSTDLTFSNTSIVSVAQSALETKNGVLIVDACGPRNPILFKAPTAVRLLPPQPVRDHLVLEVVAPYQEMVHVEVVSLLGERQMLVSGVAVDEGTSEIRIPTGAVYTGSYIVRVTTERGGEFALPMVIVR